MGRSPRERQERVEPANLTPRRMRRQAARGIDPDQIREIYFRERQTTAASLASTSSLPSAAKVASMPGLTVLPVSAARSGCATWPSLRPLVSANVRSVASIAAGRILSRLVPRRHRAASASPPASAMRPPWAPSAAAPAAPGKQQNLRVLPESWRAPSALASAPGCGLQRGNRARGRCDARGGEHLAGQSVVVGLTDVMPFRLVSFA